MLKRPSEIVKSSKNCTIANTAPSSDARHGFVEE